MSTSLHSVPASTRARKRAFNVVPVYDAELENKAVTTNNKSGVPVPIKRADKYYNTPPRPPSGQRTALADKRTNTLTSTPYAPPPPPPLSTKHNKNIGFNTNSKKTLSSPSIFVKSRKSKVLMPRISNMNINTNNNSPVKMIKKMKSASNSTMNTKKALSASVPPPVVSIPAVPLSARITRQSLALSRSSSQSISHSNSCRNASLDSGKKEDTNIVLLSIDDDSDYSLTSESDHPSESSSPPNYSLQRRQSSYQQNTTKIMTTHAIKSRKASNKPVNTKSPYLEDLQILLQSVSQNDPIPFQEYLDNFSIDQLASTSLPSHSDAHTPAWIKLGEATFSEVFTTTVRSAGKEHQKVVMKVIPLMNEISTTSELPACTEPRDVTKEIKITKELGTKNGFVKLLSTAVVCGKYPASLLEEWDEWVSTGKSENICPDVFESHQKYAILCLPYNGTDLDNYNMKSWKEALSVFVQVLESIGSAETELNFEHRDLHCGNILVQYDDDDDDESDKTTTVAATNSLVDDMKNLSLDKSTASLQRSTRSTSSLQRNNNQNSSQNSNNNIQTTIIDYSLSRMGKDGDDIIWADLSNDEQLFGGQGDYQYDVYRTMRIATDNNWQTFHPSTNVLWLHFLAYKLSKRDPKSSGPCQGLRVPVIPESSSSSTSSIKSRRVTMIQTTSSGEDLIRRRRLQAKKQERKCYDMLIEIEKALALAVNSATGTRRGGARSAKQAPMKNAADVSIWVKTRLASLDL